MRPTPGGLTPNQPPSGLALLAPRGTLLWTFFCQVRRAGIMRVMKRPLEELRAATISAVLRGPGKVASALRLAIARGEAPPALQTLVHKIRAHAYRVTDEDIAAARQQYGEDELFEIIVSAAVGAADERLSAALAALEQA